jgi:hypothetical protein
MSFATDYRSHYRASRFREAVMTPLLFTALFTGDERPMQNADPGTQVWKPAESGVTRILNNFDKLDVDQGTRIVTRSNYRSFIEGTTLFSVDVDGAVVPFERPTRMARIRALAPLSFREWAPVFGVSHAAVKQWADGDEPDREKLDRVLNALSEAAVRHPDLVSWLVAPLPGMDVRPLDLLRDDRWQAFRGAIRAESAPTVSTTPEELIRRRRAQAAWAVPERQVIADEA